MMVEQPRARVVVGNWKMYKTHAEAESYLTDLIPRVKEAPVAICLAVPFTLIQLAAQLAIGTNIAIGAQNMNDASEGAFTGEIAARMLVEAGATFVIIGHSERRRLFGETNLLCNRKLKRALESTLRPILCVGETLSERESNQTDQVLEKQLVEGLEGIPASDISKLWIAYEPVWAIGNGTTATPEIAEKEHRFIRKRLESLATPEVAAQVLILYGGSVRSANAAELSGQPDIDGLLVGGASLSPEIFSQIVHAVNPLPLGKQP